MTSVSVVIPTYNRREMVMEAVESVLLSTHSNVECILVDDGSTDGTAGAVAIRFPAVRMIRTNRSGVSSARNRGTRAARHPLIAYLDSDDLFEPGKLQEQAAWLDRHPEIDLVHTGEIWIHRGREKGQPGYLARGGGDQFDASLTRCVISPSSVMMRKSLWKRSGGWDESMPACEDYDLWIRITRDHPVGYLPRPLVIKRGGHPDQLSRTVPALDYWRLYALVKLLAETPPGHKRREPILRAIERKSGIFCVGRVRRGFPDASFYRELPARCRAGEIPLLPPLTTTERVVRPG